MSRDQRTKQRDDDVTETTSFGIALGLTVVAIALSNPRTAEIFESRDVPLWTSVVFAVLFYGALVAWSVYMRTVVPVGIALFSAPTFVAGTVIRLTEPDPQWAIRLRGVGMALTIATALVASLMYARRKRELERLVFAEGSAIALFVTVIIAAVYGIAESAFDAPHVPVLWVPVVAGVVWLVCLNILSKRYS
jgi:hypothetical protein